MQFKMESELCGRFPFDQIFRFEIPVFHATNGKYFPVLWTNPSQAIRFQVSRENKKIKRKSLLPFLLALGFLHDSEVKRNDILGEGRRQYHFDRMNSKGILDYIKGTIPLVTFERRAGCSLERLCSHFTWLTCIFAVHTIACERALYFGLTRDLFWVRAAAGGSSPHQSSHGRSARAQNKSRVRPK